MSERNLNFDEVINRKNTGCIKYDFAVKRGMPEDILPLWVADMDFKTSSYIEDALVERARHPIFGYTEPLEDYFNAIKSWMKKHHDWDIKEEWIIKTPGVVFALAMAIKAFTKPGDAVLLQSPVYYPFSEVIIDNERTIISNDLFLGDDNKYHIDFDDFEKKIQNYNIKLFLLCNPHNPVGRVWTLEELTKLGEICLRNHVIVVSDEIHHDFIFGGNHTVFANISKEFADITVTCTSVSKTFNLAGLLHSNIFISNEVLRRKFQKQLDAAGISQVSIMGIVGTTAAYRDGEEWYQAMLDYVRANIAFVQDYVSKNIPNVSMIEHEGTYLVWLDFRKTGLSVDEIDDRIINKAKLWLDSGQIFGKTGEGFQRINVACPRSILEEALNRLKIIFGINLSNI